ncbi:MAG: response regulator transcription factor [Merdibacter sp.]
MVNKKINILFIEDDATVCKSLTAILETYGYQVTCIQNYQQAINTVKTKTNEFDLYLIDIHIPGGDGFELCRMIRNKETTPIIFLTGVNDEASIVFGLNLGADDYITKPFSLQVLLAKIKTVLRRNDRTVNNFKKIHTGDLTIDFVNRIVVSNGKRIMLTPMQFHIMEILVKNHGITVTREQITSILWNENDEFVEDNTLSVHVSNLKSKIGKYNGKPYVESIRGVGYQWKLDVILCTD